MVGAARFELTTPCAQGRCATRLRYAPTITGSLILPQRCVAAPKKHERLAFPVSRPHHPPNQNRMIALFEPSRCRTFQMCERTINERRTRLGGLPADFMEA